MTNSGAGERAAKGEGTRWPGGLLAMAMLVALYYAIQFPSVWFGQTNALGAPPAWVENGAWLYMTQHHLAQMVLALAVIAVVGRMRFGDWGLNFRNWRRSLRMTRSFAMIFGSVIAVGLVLQIATGMEPRRAPEMAPADIAGRLFFMLAISGLSEEILFRGMMQTWLTRWFPGAVRLSGLELPGAGVITALIFAVVHVNFTLAPLAITHLYWPQVVLAFVLGVTYSVAYQRTGSLLGPILMHNISNGMMALSTLIVAGWATG